MAVEIYSTDTDSGQLTVIRKDGHADYRVVKEIPVGNAPRGSVKFTRDGRGFVSNTSANHISEIDALTHREVARITVGFGPRGLGIVPGERYLLASNSGSNTVSVVDLEAREEVCQVAVGRDPRHMAINKEGTIAYISVWGSGYIAKLDRPGSRPDARACARPRPVPGSPAPAAARVPAPRRRGEPTPPRSVVRRGVVRRRPGAVGAGGRSTRRPAPRGQTPTQRM
ncbi:YncE family protein [Streptomyces sp. NPDC054962]